MASPVIAERRKGGTPWHAHHIAERYGLLTIITSRRGRDRRISLAERAVVESQGGPWTPRSSRSAGTWTDRSGMWWMSLHGSVGGGAARASRTGIPAGADGAHSDTSALIAATGAGLQRRRVLHRPRGAHRRDRDRADSGGARRGVRASRSSRYTRSWSAPSIHSTSPCWPGPQRCSSCP